MHFFTSDTHFNHKNICRGVSSWADKTGTRDFLNLDIMNKTMIDNINAVVQAGDVLYHLGDFAFGDRNLIPEFRAAINCRRIILIRGNHDEHIFSFRNCFEKIVDYEEVVINRKQLNLFHYPIASWNNIRRGSIHLFGHEHGHWTNPSPGSMDVGMDTNEFKPYSLDEVITKCGQPVGVGHHKI